MTYSIIPDLITDNVILSENFRNVYGDEYFFNWNRGFDRAASAWSGPYSLIYSASSVLEQIDNMQNATDAQKNHYRAHAQALRAIAHFDILRFFSEYDQLDQPGAVLRIDTQLLEKVSRNTVAETYTFVIDQLLEAQTLMQNAKDADDVALYTSEQFRLTPTAIDALLCRVYLYKKDYANCITYADKVIAAGTYDLLSSTAEYQNLYADNVTSLDKNAIIVLHRTANSDNNEAFWSATTGQAEVYPAADLISSYEAGDVRPAAIFDTSTKPGSTLVAKYLPKNGGTYTKALRYSEIILNKAEAQFMSGDETSARTTVNLLRNAVGASEFSTSGPTLKADILAERRRELCFEGHRFFDFKRNGKPAFKRADDTGLDAGDYRYLFPIPEDEALVNTEIQQNPNY